jgi:hypothetical protein
MIRIWLGTQWRCCRKFSQSDQRFRSYGLWKLSMAAGNFDLLNQMMHFSTSEFECNRCKICGNSEYQSRRKFHKLSKEGGNSELWYRTKKPWRVEVGRVIEIWLGIQINSLCLFWFSKFVSWCNMDVWCHAICLPYTSSPKEKWPNIDGVCVVSGNSHSSPWLVQMKQLTQ